MIDRRGWLLEPLDYSGRRVTAMGLGAFGGGEGAVRFLAERGARVTVTDLKSEDELSEAVARIRNLPNVALNLGRHEEADFVRADLVVANPAVPRSSRFLELARKAGVPLTSEMNLFWLHHRGRTIGVTGSNGKSTTTTLVYEMLRGAGIPVRLGGNIGRSLLPEVEEIAPGDWTVLELSSFQLADLDHLQRSPEIAAVTNFTPNHQDRHASLDEYRAAKQSILRWQRDTGIAILNADDPDVANWPAKGVRMMFGARPDAAAQVAESSIVIHHSACEFRIDLKDAAHLPGRHNRMNAAAAALAAIAAGADRDAVHCGLRAFRGLPHRLEFVGEWNGRRFYNDSKSTTPDAAVAALNAFGPAQSIVLIAGGADKHVDLSALAAAIARRVKAVALIGETARSLEAGMKAAVEPGGSVPQVKRAGSLGEAFGWAVECSEAGNVVLLSPGCASLDWFANYEDRGRRFAEFVAALPSQWVVGSG